MPNETYGSHICPVHTVRGIVTDAGPACNIFLNIATAQSEPKNAEGA